MKTAKRKKWTRQVTDIGFMKEKVIARGEDKVVFALFRSVVGLVGTREYTTNQIAEKLGLAPTKVTNIRSEVSRAAKKGFKTLEEYFAAGRPCVPGKEVIA